MSENMNEGNVDQKVPTKSGDERDTVGSYSKGWSGRAPAKKSMNKRGRQNAKKDTADRTNERMIDDIRQQKADREEKERAAMLKRSAKKDESGVISNPNPEPHIVGLRLNDKDVLKAVAAGKDYTSLKLGLTSREMDTIFGRLKSKGWIGSDDKITASGRKMLNEANSVSMSDIYGKDSVSLDNLSTGKKFKFAKQDSDNVHTKTGPGAYTTDGKPHKTGAKVRVIPESTMTKGKVTGIPNVGPTKRGKCDKCGVHDPMLIKGKCSHCRREGWPSMKDKKMGEAVSLVRTKGVTGLTESRPWLEVDKKRDPFDIMREECNAIVAEEEAREATDISQGRFDHLRKTGKDALDKLRKPRKGLTVRRQDQDGTTRTVNVTVPQKESANHPGSVAGWIARNLEKSLGHHDVLARSEGKKVKVTVRGSSPGTITLDLSRGDEFTLSDKTGIFTKPENTSILVNLRHRLTNGANVDEAAPLKESAQSLSISRRLDEGSTQKEASNNLSNTLSESFRGVR